MSHPTMQPQTPTLLGILLGAALLFSSSAFCSALGAAPVPAAQAGTSQGQTDSSRLVLSPPSGAVVSTSSITVRIKGANWQELWVDSASASGGPKPVRTKARAFANDSFAVGVPLWDGTSRLTVFGRLPNGQTERQTLDVRYQPPGVPGVRVSATPAVTVPTAPVQISATYTGIGTPVEAWIDADGDGQIDRSIPPTGAFGWKYATEGYFSPRIIVRAPDGILYDSTFSPVPVTVAAIPTLTETAGLFELAVPALDIAVDRMHARVLVLTEDSKLRVYDESGALLSSHSLAQGPGLVAIDVDLDGNVYAVHVLQHQLLKFSYSSAYAPDTSFGINGIVGGLGAGTGQFNTPRDVYCRFSLSSLELWVSDSGNNRLQRLDGTGAATLVFPTGVDMTSPVSAIADYAGRITVIDGNEGDLAVFELNGTRIAYRPAVPSSNPSRYNRADVAADYGVYIADQARRTLQRFDRNGVLLSSLELGTKKPVATALTTNGRTLVAVAGAMRLSQLSGAEPAGESPTEVAARYFTAIQQGADATARSLIITEIDEELIALLQHPSKGPAYRSLAGRTGSITLVSRSEQLATVGAIVDAGTPTAQAVTVDLRRDPFTNRWLLVGL